MKTFVMSLHVVSVELCLLLLASMHCLVVNCVSSGQDENVVLFPLVFKGSDPDTTVNKLGPCEGDCDNDNDCMNGLYCHQRKSYDAIPGCIGGEQESSRTDYCTFIDLTDSVGWYESLTEFNPTVTPSPSPTSAPSPITSDSPSGIPSQIPSFQPSTKPSTVPSDNPFATPSSSMEPTTSQAPTELEVPSAQPSFLPSANPSIKPSVSPSESPTPTPSIFPSISPSSAPSSLPSVTPSLSPSTSPSNLPTGLQSQIPPRPFEDLKSFGGDPPESALPLQNCQGDCDAGEDQCAEGLICFTRAKYQAVPGCLGGEEDGSRTDYCIYPDAVLQAEHQHDMEEGTLHSYGFSPELFRYPLGLCEGDCDNDSDCDAGMYCFKRDGGQYVPGCVGGEQDMTNIDYCVPIPGYVASDQSDEYVPGNLSYLKEGILLSQGLDVKLLATVGQNVIYHDGSVSSQVSHAQPDAGATFPDTREGNEGGWVYVSNSEVSNHGEGGVGAFTFDSMGNLLNYEMILTDTTMNCGGGRTPWGTWVSCEENGDHGNIYQVDPLGIRPPQMLTLGKHGGNFESFAYDIRDETKPRFFVTEDKEEGPLRMFTPNQPNWDDPWQMLHGPGETRYLELFPNGNQNGGTFRWRLGKGIAKQNAAAYYPYSEGIDVHGSQLFFICKKIKQMFVLDLDNLTYMNGSTTSGLFDGQPDQIQRILVEDGDNSNTLLYFTEEGGQDAGVHARDSLGRYYTIFESPTFSDETTGLAFSPDKKFMYIAYQNNGKIFALWRRDGKPFGAELVDVKYHESNAP